MGCSMSQEPPFTIYTDKTKACHDYVWYSSENLNANTALQVRPDRVGIPAADTRLDMLMIASTQCRPTLNLPLIMASCDGLGTRLSQ